MPENPDLGRVDGVSPGGGQIITLPDGEVVYVNPAGEVTPTGHVDEQVRADYLSDAKPIEP